MEYDPKDKIMVVLRETLFGKNNEHYFNGFQSIEKFDFTPIIEKNYFFAWRHVAKGKQKLPAEEDESMQQILPYVIVKHKNKLFVYKRLNKGGEKRLWELYSIGVGGHINPIDETNTNLILDALKREVNEELKLNQKINPKLVGFINDDSNPVGKVHFAMVYLVDLIHDEIDINEKQKLDGKMMEVKNLPKEIVENFEPWSKHSFDFIKKLF